MRDGWFTGLRETGDESVRARLEAIFHPEWSPIESDPDERPGSGAVDLDLPWVGEVLPPAGSVATGGAHRASDGRAPISRGVRARLDPGRRGALAVVAAVVVAAGVVGWRVVADQPRSRAVPVTANLSLGSGPTPDSTLSPGPSASSGPPAPIATASSTARVVVVDVVGRVRRPGLVRLPIGSRVDDAVRAAGGVIAGTDLSGLNLARVLTDGEQISVGTPAVAGSGGGPSASGTGTGTGTGSGSTLINLNTATLEQLDSLPGVGPVLAQRIIDWRSTHGQFDSVDQLTQVTGVGDAKFADLKPLVTV